MSVTKTLGGERIGTGGKMKVHLHNYGRSTHNLGRIWTSSMAPGTLVPFLVEPIRNGDDFDIQLAGIVKTTPTLRPLFGSFKMQFEIFKADVRLYCRQLHNNKLGVGLDMSKVILPKVYIRGKNPNVSSETPNQEQINPGSLYAYLGMRGLGRDTRNGFDILQITRSISAIPLLAYWDYFKNYHANKQEENAYVITAKQTQPQANAVPQVQRVEAQNLNPWTKPQKNPEGIELWPLNIIAAGWNITPMTGAIFGINLRDPEDQTTPYTSNQGLRMVITNNTNYLSSPTQGANEIRLFDGTIENAVSRGIFTQAPVITNNEISYILKDWTGLQSTLGVQPGYNGTVVIVAPPTGETPFLIEPAITSFPLKNIDDMREDLLAAPNEIPYIIDETKQLPYNLSATSIDPTAPQGTILYQGTHALAPMGGLALKTYMSDRFNNWLAEETIDGANGIAEITAVDTSDGSFTMDTLNLAQKVYNMLNRIAVSGGTYYDWQEAVYGEEVKYKSETPVYLGGMSQEIRFEDVTNLASDGSSPLGELAGKGYMKHAGGKIHCKATEPGILMGIVSITPRLTYSQGNKWYTRLETMDDMHKPALDGIGFQELITDEMAAWDTKVTIDGSEKIPATPTYSSAGKQPAWIQYMTSQNESYGTFANPNQEMTMTLNRRYEKDYTTGKIADLTTYIDPTKYNYAFAYVALESQNFWVQIAIDITARRKMSAKQIPNL